MQQEQEPSFPRLPFSSVEEEGKGKEDGSRKEMTNSRVKKGLCLGWAGWLAGWKGNSLSSSFFFLFSWATLTGGGGERVREKEDDRRHQGERERGLWSGEREREEEGGGLLFLRMY